MIETEITRLFGIRYPIIQGGLQGLGTSALVSSVSSAGGLGLLTAGSYESKAEMLADIETTRKLTARPFGVNCAIGIRKPMDEFMEGVIEAQVPIVFTSGHNPEKYMDMLKKTGTKVIHVAPTVRFALKAQSLGCDAAVVNGYECGGHPGMEDTTSLILVQKASKELSIPVIAAGGFATGRSVLAALALGAAGVQMGTRFLLSEEIRLHEQVKQRLLAAGETETILVKQSIRKPARVLKTDTAEELYEKEKKGASFEEIFPYISGESYAQLIQSGDLSKGVIATGQTIGLMDEIKPVEEIMKDIVSEFNEALSNIQGAASVK